MNGLGNCIYEICCPPRSEGAVKALADEMSERLGWNKNQPGHRDKDTDDLALSVATWVLDNFDLAPKGSLQAFKDAVRDYAREGYVKDDSTKLKADHGKEA